MNDFGDYLDDMIFTHGTDRSIERLFAGSLDSDDDLASVAGLFEALRAESSIVLDEGIVAAFVHSASTASAAAASPRAVAATATSKTHIEGIWQGPLLVSLRRRVAAIAVAAAVFVGGMSGVAVAADHAKPGDALYGIDRALEAVGIGNGRTAERLVEVQALFDAGDISRGLQHAAEAVEIHAPDHSAASDALSEAADRVLSGVSVHSAATRERVAELLSYLSDNANDLDDGKVADLAREIGRSEDRPVTPPSVGPSSDSGSFDRRPIDPPGQSDFTPGSPTPPNNRP